MATDSSFMQYVADQVSGAGGISYRKMFGEYTLYVNDKVVALVADNQLFVKPTAAGRELLGQVVEGSPYPGAKLHFQLTEQLEDSELLARLLTLTAAELPAPKPKKKKK